MCNFFIIAEPNWSRWQPNDVLCSYETRFSSFVGNQSLNIVVKDFLHSHPQYDMGITQDRAVVSEKIVKIIHQRNGRFLARTKQGSWKEICPDLALRWLSLYIKRLPSL